MPSFEENLNTEILQVNTLAFPLSGLGMGQAPNDLLSPGAWWEPSRVKSLSNRRYTVVCVCTG